MKAAKNSGTLVVFLTAIFFLRDAIDVVDAGINVVAHSVRDTRISKSFADKMAQQDVILAPTLVREEAELAFAGRITPISKMLSFASARAPGSINFAGCEPAATAPGMNCRARRDWHLLTLKP